MGLKEQLKKLVGLTAKESEVPTAMMDRMKRQAEAAEKVRDEIKTEKER